MKKRILSIFLAVALIATLCACGGKPVADNSGSTQNSSNSETTDNESGVSVEKGLLNVEITIPASFFEDSTEDEIKATAEENGFSGYTINGDGSVTYKMSKAKHKEFLDRLKDGMNESISELLNGEDAVESFQRIEYADDFTKFDVYVDKDKYSAFDSFYALSFYLTGAYYQIFEGKDEDAIDVVVNFVDSTSNEVIDSASYREMLNNANSGEN